MVQAEPARAEVWQLRFRANTVAYAVDGRGFKRGWSAEALERSAASAATAWDYAQEEEIYGKRGRSYSGRADFG